MTAADAVRAYWDYRDDRETWVADEFIALADAAIAELKAENEALRRQVEALKVCGNCNHWWSGLMGCAMDSSQEVVCEGFDHCKVFTQLADKPETREPCWTDRKQDR